MNFGPSSSHRQLHPSARLLCLGPRDRLQVLGLSPDAHPLRPGARPASRHPAWSPPARAYLLITTAVHNTCLVRPGLVLLAIGNTPGRFSSPRPLHNNIIQHSMIITKKFTEESIRSITINLSAFSSHMRGIGTSREEPVPE